MIDGLPCDHAIGFGDGLATGNPMPLGGIKSSDNLLAVISWVPSTGVYLSRDADDFTVTAGAIEASTEDMSDSGTKFVAIWTNAPDA
ncbi:MAG: hypothetical protein QGD93_11880 [Actinomycetota bacterium]|nr:hypothetical protein [Actinomycetota bacterium]